MSQSWYCASNNINTICIWYCILFVQWKRTNPTLQHRPTRILTNVKNILWIQYSLNYIGPSDVIYGRLLKPFCLFLLCISIKPSLCGNRCELRDGWHSRETWARPKIQRYNGCPYFLSRSLVLSHIDWSRTPQS